MPSQKYLLCRLMHIILVYIAAFFILMSALHLVIPLTVAIPALLACLKFLQNLELTLPRVCRGDSPLKTLLYQCKSCLKIYSTSQSNYFDLIGPKNTSHEVVVNYCLFCFVHSHLSKQLLMFSDVV